MTRKLSPLISDVLTLLNAHRDAFYAVVDIARKTKHPVPVDTRAWSQILVSALCTIDGLSRKKGADLIDGSDVKGAITWEAIDTPRFNGVIKAGTKSSVSGTMASLNAMPYIFLVLWDNSPRSHERCRIWCVRPRVDQLFRAMCQKWYACHANDVRPPNFQLHPPRGTDSNTIRNSLGTFEYPLLFSAERDSTGGFKLQHHDPLVLTEGLCRMPPIVPKASGASRRATKRKR
jgi:hypothetical protein